MRSQVEKIIKKDGDGTFILLKKRKALKNYHTFEH